MIRVPREAVPEEPTTGATAGAGNAEADLPPIVRGTPEVDPKSPVRRNKSLGHQAARGTFVTLAGQISNLCIQMASVVVLARMLTPTSYGLVAMVLAVVGIAHIFRDFGLSPAAIQSPTLSSGQRTNLFWLNAGIGFFLTALVFASAPLIQDIYNAEHLADITRVLSLTFLINGAATQYRADLNRDMRFSRLAIADVSSSVAALILAIAIALVGGGYWALIVQQLSQGTVMLIMVAIYCRWLPKRWVSGEPLGSFIKFGWDYVGAQLINYAANNLDSFLIGYRFGAGPSGLYNRAFQLLQRPLVQLRSPSLSVALPTLSKIREDRIRFTSYLLKGQVLLAYPICLALAVVVGAAVPVVGLALGSEWIGVVPIIRWLCIAGIFQTLGFVSLWVYLAEAKTKDLRNFTLLSATIRVACVVAGVQWGVVGVAAGFGIGPAIAWPIGVVWLSRIVDIPAGRLLIGGARTVVFAAVSTAACWLFCSSYVGFPALILIATSLLVAVVCFGLLALLFRPYRGDFNILIFTAKKGLSRAKVP